MFSGSLQLPRPSFPKEPCNTKCTLPRTKRRKRKTNKRTRNKEKTEKQRRRVRTTTTTKRMKTKRTSKATRGSHREQQQKQKRKMAARNIAPIARSGSQCSRDFATKRQRRDAQSTCARLSKDRAHRLAIKKAFPTDSVRGQNGGWFCQRNAAAASVRPALLQRINRSSVYCGSRRWVAWDEKRGSIKYVFENTLAGERPKGSANSVGTGASILASR